LVGFVKILFVGKQLAEGLGEALGILLTKHVLLAGKVWEVEAILL